LMMCCAKVVWLCVVVHTPLLQMSWAWNFWKFHPKNTSFAHTRIPSKSHSARGTYSTLGPIYSTQNRSMWDVTVGVCATWYIWMERNPWK
jgi:hypothetical protein